MSVANDESSREAASSSAGLERWTFRYTIDNFGPERLESGQKLCENDGCKSAADMIVTDDYAIYFACSQCAQLIPGAIVLRSNFCIAFERLAAAIRARAEKETT